MRDTEQGQARLLEGEHNEGKGRKLKMSNHNELIKTCRQCGREYETDRCAFSYKSDGFCSEGCRDAAYKRYRENRLKEMKEKGSKILAKWEKALEKDVKKSKARIEKLDSALRGNDPDAIVKAIKGSFFTRIFCFIYRFFKIITFTIGIICILRGALWFYNGISNVNSTSEEYIENATETTNESSKQAEKTEVSQPVVSNAVPAEVVVPSADEGKASDMK